MATLSSTNLQKQILTNLLRYTSLKINNNKFNIFKIIICYSKIIHYGICIISVVIEDDYILIFPLFYSIRADCIDFRANSVFASSTCNIKPDGAAGDSKIRPTAAGTEACSSPHSDYDSYFQYRVSSSAFISQLSHHILSESVIPAH